MGFVQQGWVGRSRGKMPLPRARAAFLLAPVGAASCRDRLRNRGGTPLPQGGTPLPRKALPRGATL